MDDYMKLDVDDKLLEQLNEEYQGSQPLGDQVSSKPDEMGTNVQEILIPQNCVEMYEPKLNKAYFNNNMGPWVKKGDKRQQDTTGSCKKIAAFQQITYTLLKAVMGNNQSYH